MVTLKGGARKHEFKTDAGLRYEGRDHKGMASFLPAGCERRLRLTDVAWEWGAIALSPASLPCPSSVIRPFVEPEPFVFGLLSQMQILMDRDGILDATYCDVMTLALIEFLLRKSYPKIAASKPKYCLSPAQLRSTLDRIEAQLNGPIRIFELSAPLGLSEGHFHRAFRGATGRSPLQVITERRIERAATLLMRTDRPVSDIAFDVGFVSPSHMARVFRSILGSGPSDYRREFRGNASMHNQDLP